MVYQTSTSQKKNQPKPTNKIEMCFLERSLQSSFALEDNLGCREPISTPGNVRRNTKRPLQAVSGLSVGWPNPSENEATQVSTKAKFILHQLHAGAVIEPLPFGGICDGFVI